MRCISAFAVGLSLHFQFKSVILSSGRSLAAGEFTRGEAAQTIAVTVVRGYALNFVLMAPTRTAAEQMASSLGSIEFPAAAKPRPAPAPAPAKP